MQEQQFRTYLKGRLKDNSIESYVDYCKRVENLLLVDLSICELSESGIQSILEKIKFLKIPDKSISNSQSALRAYARMTGQLS